MSRKLVSHGSRWTAVCFLTLLYPCQQERNLWYVALTRAKRELYLVRGLKA